jgi:hypothetical protein
VVVAFDQGVIGIHDKVTLRWVNGDMIKTSTGRVLFNQIIPDELGYKNQTFGKKELRNLIAEVFTTCGTATAAKVPGRH